jgi:hypothetical protein
MGLGSCAGGGNIKSHEVCDDNALSPPFVDACNVNYGKDAISMINAVRPSDHLATDKGCVPPALIADRAWCRAGLYLQNLE